MKIISLPLLLILSLKILSNRARVYIRENFYDLADAEMGDKSKSLWKVLAIQSEHARGKNYESLESASAASVSGKLECVEDLYIINKIDALPPYASAFAFRQLKQLRSLHLEENSLPALIAGDFGGLELSKLGLVDNGINRIEPRTFGNSTIDRIDLSHNRLSDIPARLFDTVPLTKLILANNSIRTIAARAFCPDLTYLDLSYNLIRDTPITAFENLYALKYLNVSHNNLPTVTSVYWLRNLQVLDLSYNVIRLLINGSFEDYPKLRRLHLEHNELLYLNPHSFIKPSPIQVLHIERNKLAFLPGELAEIFSKLRYFKYGGNPWSCACLIPVEGFLTSAKIQVDACDKKFFTDGKQAVCLTAYMECYGNETLLLLAHPDISQGLIDDYKC